MANTLTAGDGEDADVYVCIPISDPLKFPDNVISKCSMCGCAIQHRPNYPRRPRKVCLPCILPQLEEEAEDDNLNMEVRPEAMQEIKDWRKKGMN